VERKKTIVKRWGLLSTIWTIDRASSQEDPATCGRKKWFTKTAGLSGKVRGQYSTISGILLFFEALVLKIGAAASDEAVLRRDTG